MGWGLRLCQELPVLMRRIPDHPFRLRSCWKQHLDSVTVDDAERRAVQDCSTSETLFHLCFSFFGKAILIYGK